MDQDKMNAIILANALTYTGQSYSRKDLNSRGQQWSRFMNSLDWNKVKERTEKPKFKKVVNLFAGIGVPIVKKKDK